MTPPTSPPPPAAAPPVIASGPPRGALVAAPGFLAALRGVWLLTWRRHFTARSLGWALLAMLGLPFVVYVSAVSHQSVVHQILGYPEADANRLFFRLNRLGPLAPQDRTNLLAIFNTEYHRTIANWQAPPANGATVEAGASQSDQLSEWNRRLVSRVEDAVTPGQFRVFEEFQSRSYGEKARILNRPRWNPSEAFYNLLVEFYFFLVLPMVCARSCGAVFRDELQAETLGFLLTRPVSRATLVVVKYISQTAWLSLLLLVQTALLFLSGAIRDIPHLAGVAPVFLAAQLFAVPAWSALGLLLGLFTNRYIALALVYGFVVELGIGRIPTNINTLSLMRHLKDFLANNADLAKLFDPPATAAIWTPLAAMLVGTAVFLGASVLLFMFREYHVNAEMQK